MVFCRAKISMRLSSKNSEGSGLRKISSLRPGVSSPDGGVGSPFQPASQKAAPPAGSSNPPVSLQTRILFVVMVLTQALIPLSSASQESFPSSVGTSDLLHWRLLAAPLRECSVAAMVGCCI